MKPGHRRATIVSGAVLVVLLAGCEPISEPWVSGEWGERLEDERTRTHDQKRELERRLQNYGDAYQ
ncbi:MAG: hypothetical protein U5K33_05815 [Halofilum sp. (in: g-proteobacteria)]|nr:hypothetical protein [Halofilum sp. (in: g-proteobacteria)]